MNKKGWTKTFEAALAVIFIFGFIYYFTLQQEPQETAGIPANVETAQSFILQEISTTEQLRTCALRAATAGDCAQAGCPTITRLVADHAPGGYSFACEICTTANTCLQAQLPTDVSLYTDSIFLSGAQSKVVRVYFWKEQ